MEDHSKLHVVILPWLAFGHLIPALHLSKTLASKGHHVSFVSTPKNISRLPKIPPSLSSFITFINLPFPRVENLPENAESSTDISPDKSHLLMKAFDLLQPHLSEFLENSPHRPDYIIFDYAAYWAPALAAKFDIPCAYFGTFNASCLSFLGPPSVLLSPEGRFTSLESFTTVPKWIPFPSSVVYRMHELMPLFAQAAAEAAAGGPASDQVSEIYRWAITLRDSKFIALRSCDELESQEIKLLAEILEKPVIPVGSLHPSTQDHPEINQDEEKWEVIGSWLEKQEKDSVVYVSFGTEAALSQTQVTELATGLEKSGIPFFWVLRKPRDASVADILTWLPDGFLDRVKDRGIVWTSWAPQVKILGHESVGGVLTHCGWSSVIESLGFGRALVLMPMLSDQGLNARFLEGKKLGLEIPRDPRDGSFTSDSVSESLRRLMVDTEGEILRNNAKEMSVIGDKAHMGRYVDEFVGYLQAHKRQPVSQNV